MRRAPGDQALEAGGIDGTGRITQQSRRRDAERMRKQQPCVETRVVDPGLTQSRGGLIESVVNRESQGGQGGRPGGGEASCYAAWPPARFA
jgi:hypothetical protein